MGEEGGCLWWSRGGHERRVEQLAGGCGLVLSTTVSLLLDAKGWKDDGLYYSSLKAAFGVGYVDYLYHRRQRQYARDVIGIKQRNFNV